MADDENKARQLEEQADQLFNARGIMTWFNKSRKTEDAIALCRKAALIYKLNQNWNKAGDCFVKCAHSEERFEEAGRLYSDAAACYEKGDYIKAIESYNEAIKIYKEQGRYHMVGKFYEGIGELYKKNEKFDEAIVNYKEAARHYETEKSSSSADKCNLHAAELLALSREYEKAIALYEKVAVAYRGKDILRHAARDIYFRALICALCADPQWASRLLEKYEAEYSLLQNSRESKLIADLVGCTSIDDFARILEEFDRISKLDEFKTTLFLVAKEKVDDGAL